MRPWWITWPWRWRRRHRYRKAWLLAYKGQRVPAVRFQLVLDAVNEGVISRSEARVLLGMQ
jgi:hypothetical protein